MKLKSKLVISFCIIMFVPIFLAFLIIAAFFRVQWQMMAQNIEVMPDARGLFLEIILAVVITLFVTAGMLMIWIYRSMVTPIRRLQVAANNIKEGNLDFTIDTVGAEQDEMNELCVTFEEMRRRLKENAEEKLVNEQENKNLISNIAHDLKTPITAVKGYAEGIIDGVAKTPERSISMSERFTARQMKWIL